MSHVVSIRAALYAVVLMLAAPAFVSPQNPELVGSFRPYFFVLVAFAAGWVLIAAWVYRIGKKMREVSSLIEERGGQG